MLSFRFLQIFIIFNLSIKLRAGDCSCCVPPELICDPDPASFDSISGNYKATFGVDGTGCMTVTFNCTDDAGVSDSGYLYDSANVSSLRISLLKETFRTTSSCLETQ